MFSQYYLGVRISQNDNAVPTFDKLFKKLESDGTAVSRIIELGTYHGGLSIFLGIYCYLNSIPFITYDVHPFVNDLPKIKSLFDTLKIDYRIKNINYSTDEIVSEIQKEGTTLLLCDGGNKIHEFNRFSCHIKQGDIIMAHDYANNKLMFDNNIKNKLWNWLEIEHQDIADACAQNNLVDFMRDEFENAVWACKRKQ